VRPSLGGESFGMVLAEALAAGTPVVASDIPGYRDIVRAGVNGVVVPAGDAPAVAAALRDVWEAPAWRSKMSRAAARDAERFAWPRVAAQILEAYDDAIAARRSVNPQPVSHRHRATALDHQAVPLRSAADGQPGRARPARESDVKAA
jgi:phosphatidylinositol alpha-mannosyltransferase